MNKIEKLKLKREIYQDIYDAIVLGDTGIENLSKQMDKLDAQIEVLDGLYTNTDVV